LKTEERSALFGFMHGGLLGATAALAEAHFLC
jgi:gas vesicle protein